MASRGNLPVALIAGLFGMLIGSFLNIVIYRVPKMMQRESDNQVSSESGKELPQRIGMLVGSARYYGNSFASLAVLSSREDLHLKDCAHAART